MEEIDTQELKLHAPLIPYVQKHYAKLLPIVKQSKNTAFTNCIWHEENTASLAFFANGSYKCFGCGEYGDIITLVQKIERLSFQEACKMIGDNVGYEVVLEPPNPLHEEYKDKMNNHTKRYWYNLQKDAGAMQYLKNDRGLTQDTIDLFRLGLTDTEEYKYRTDIGGIAHRISIPILEHKKKPKCVGMAYRTLKDEDPKYLNDINQDGRREQDPNLAGVFIKGNMLYGYPMAIENIHKQDFVYLVEGYFDVMSMHQTGITNVIGSMGTALTEAQMTQISKATNNVVLFLDNDSAGTKAMIKSLSSLYSTGLNVAVCQIPGFKDPADLCKRHNFNLDKISAIIKGHTRQGIELVIDTVVSKYETMVINERTKALSIAMPIIDCVKDEHIKNMYRSLLNKRLDII